jgi:hypothetical protein
MNPILARLRDLLHAQPFAPFTIKLIDGAVYEVPHEDFLTISKSGHVLFDDGASVFKTLNPLLISEINEQRPATSG